ncbi:hypothetical protein H6H01_03940 [Nostoc calcicola FACHB-3891]|nr:hypothetical protein [Nostoc calcicola FACHB-3891]
MVLPEDLGFEVNAKAQFKDANLDTLVPEVRQKIEDTLLLAIADIEKMHNS